MLARMFEQDRLMPSEVDHTGAYLIDRSGQYFEPILNFLRSGKLIIDPSCNMEGVLEEAKFYGLQKLVDVLEIHMFMTHNKPEDVALTRKDVINTIISTSPDTELRFQGVNLRDADLRKLDLRRINFKYACLAGEDCRFGVKPKLGRSKLFFIFWSRPPLQF